MAGSNYGDSCTGNVYHTRQYHIHVSTAYGRFRSRLRQCRMGDLIGFEGYLNISTPFDKREHNALWKGDRRYNDFTFTNNELVHCDYPRFYGDDGMQVLNLSSELVGCRDSEFDQYGEVAAFGIYPEW